MTLNLMVALAEKSQGFCHLGTMNNLTTFPLVVVIFQSGLKGWSGCLTEQHCQSEKRTHGKQPASNTQRLKKMH